MTVEITNPPKTFAVDRTVTLTFSGGTQGTHYSVSPVDGDPNAAGHQVVLPAETGSLPPVTVTAAGNDTADGIRTLTVTGDLDGTAFGTRTITILDDETMTANIPAEGEARIGGTPQVGQPLRAEKGSIDDANGLPTTEFPLRYSFQWVRVAAGGAETNVGTDSRTYSPIPSDAGSTIKVEVSFIDGAGNPETVPSVPTAAVLPAAGPCPAGYDWCTTMTVGVGITATGFGGGTGSLDDSTIDYGTRPSNRVEGTSIQGPLGSEDVRVSLDAYVPRGSVFNFGGTEFTADRSSERSDVGQYRWGIPANFGWIHGQKVTVSANLAPAPDSATVDGTTLVLTHAEDLDRGSTPAPGAYTVKVDGGAGPAVSSVSVGTRTVTLTLAMPVTAADTVTVDYDAPPSSPLQDVSGRDAPDFTNFPVTNDTPVVDPRGALLTPPPALTVDEGTTGSYTVELTAAPTGRVAVAVGGTSGSGLRVSPSSIAFTPSNWNVKQTVRVTAGEDSNAVDETVTLTHTVSLGGGYDGVVLPELEVTVADNDGGIVADPTALTVAEGGTGTYGLKLTRAPTSDVTVTVLGAGGAVTAGRRC